MTSHDRSYKFTIQNGRGDQFTEWQTCVTAPTLFQAADLLRRECELEDWWVVAIEEADGD